MLREYSCTKAESLAQIRASIIELQHFSKGIYLIGAPCINMHFVVFGPFFDTHAEIVFRLLDENLLFLYS